MIQNCKHFLSLIKLKHITGGLMRAMRHEDCEWKDIRYQGIIYNIMFRKIFINRWFKGTESNLKNCLLEKKKKFA